MVDPAGASPLPIIALVFDRATWALSLETNVVFGVLVFVALVTILVWRKRLFERVEDFELDETEFGVGSTKLKFKPNDLDRQVAYQIWVELSTRKIGLQLDPEHDVIEEIYDSWHAFFGVTRELVKAVPVRKVGAASTKRIINLSINLLNLGLRPHLTRWQARFRGWYEREMAKEPDDPQTIQRRFPDYAELSDDMLAVNVRLQAYRRAMYELVYGSSSTASEAMDAAVEVVEDGTLA